MAISRSSATRTSRERPARFAAAATPVSRVRGRTLSPLRHEQGRSVYRAHTLPGSVAEPTAQACPLR